MEIWKDVKGFEGIYKISNCGRVKTLERMNVFETGHIQTIRERILFGSLSHGYHRVTFPTALGKKDFAVHRLVAEAFIPNPDNKPDVNHIDGDPLNNFALNLEWVTHQENMQHAINTGLKKTKRVKQLDTNGNLIAVHCSVAEASRTLGNVEYHSNIRRALTGKTFLAYGYRWEYVQEV